MTPRERLTEILNIETRDFLNKNGFKFSPGKSQFSRTVNRIKQIIYFEGSKWNYADAAADYRLLFRMEIKDFPKWYLDNYKTEQATHHQQKVTPKSVHQPSPSARYNENWNPSAQSATHRYDFIKYPKIEISNSILHNIKNCILPYANDCTTYSGIAEKAIIPLDKFDYYMMDDNLAPAKEILNNLKLKIDEIDLRNLDLNDTFKVKSLENTLNMYNIRVERFFPDMEKVVIPIVKN